MLNTLHVIVFSTFLLLGCAVLLIVLELECGKKHGVVIQNCAILLFISGIATAFSYLASNIVFEFLTNVNH